ncbi:hypothetical protein FRB95_004751 [Tulasnella sp. JGI-2019a]|nr:hypothetical protein FRB95_004751 [Tulasnella sp. JGI-2019a]
MLLTTRILQEKWENLTPMGRMGNHDDLKGVIVYIASDASKFTIGAEHQVDGSLAGEDAS